MKVIAQVKLNPTPEQHAALLATLERANQTCDTISAAAWQSREFRRYPLQRLVYYDLRESTGLGAQLLIRCIAKVADAYKPSRKTQRTFCPTAQLTLMTASCPGTPISAPCRSGR
jgi:putative transposase